MKKTIQITTVSNENKDICSPCGGHCCKVSPGFYSPDQLLGENDSPKEKFSSLLSEGKHVFTHYEKYDESTRKSEFTWIMKPSSTLSSKFDKDGFGKCVNLTENGCSLSKDTRPVQCLALIPVTSKCHYPSEWDFDKEIKDKWIQYQSVIEELNEEYWDNVPHYDVNGKLKTSNLDRV